MSKLPTTYVKSNGMISSKFKSSLLENKIMSICLLRIESNNNGDLEATLYPGEIQKLISDKNHIYRDLKKVSKRITGHTIVLEDGKGNFKAFSMIPNAEYQDGAFKLQFNKLLKSHILGMEENFTKLSLPVMMSFENVNAFRLYELFKSEYYKASKDGKLDLEYNLAELKFIIGIANSDNEGHRNRLSEMQNNIDWDYLYDALDKKDKKYSNYNDFKKWVLEPAKLELDNKADISFEYEDGRKKGKKVLTIIFHIFKNEPSYQNYKDMRLEYEEEKDREGRQQIMPRDLPQFKAIYEEYVGHNDLAAEDIDLLLIKADMNGDLVIDAINAADQQADIYNYMGWIIKYIERGGYETIEVIQGDRDNTKRVIEVLEGYNKTIDDTAQRVWDATKNKPDIMEFLQAIDIDSVEDFELICDNPKEAYKMYINWKKSNK